MKLGGARVAWWMGEASDSARRSGIVLEGVFSHNTWMLLVVDDLTHELCEVAIAAPMRVRFLGWATMKFDEPTSTLKY